MITGNGSFVLSQRSVPAGGGMPAPPFAANSAVNGLSVNGAGQIVFGNDIGAALADLLSDREIDMSGFLFQFIDGALPKFQIDNANAFYGFGDFTTFNDPGLYMNNAGGDRVLAAIAGDVAATEYASFEMGNDTGGNESFVRLKANQGVGIENQILLEKDQLFIEMPNSGMNLLMDDANDVFSVNTGLSRYLVLDNATQNWALGDYDNFAKPVLGLFSTVNWDGAYLEAHNTNDAIFAINTGGATNYPSIIGQVTDGTNRQYELNHDEFFISAVSNRKLSIDFNTHDFFFGDSPTPTPEQNGNYIQIDDAANLLRITNTLSSMGIEINGVAGFTGTVTPVVSITVNNGIVTNVT